MIILKTTFTSKTSIEELNWNALKVYIVIESTGMFKTRELVENHLANEANKVITTVLPTEYDLNMLVFRH